MARICPKCMKVVPASCSASFTNGMDCPNCQARLEVGNGSRGLAVLAGLLAGWLAWSATSGSDSVLGQVMPVLYSVLAFGAVSPLVLMLIADLHPAPAAPAMSPAPAAAHGGHDGGHH